MRRSDRLIGVLLGVIIGVGAVILFVFLGGDRAVDEPLLDDAPPVERETTPDGGPPGP